MAVRIHIAGARNVTTEEFLAAFAELNPQSAEAVNGWCWLQASVWGVSGSKLDECLAKLSGPCLRVTSEDACRWYLRLFKQGLEPFALCHHFTFVRRGDIDEPGDEANPPSASDRAKWLELICPVLHASSASDDFFGELAAKDDDMRAEMTGMADFLMDQRTMFGSPTPRDLVARLLELPHPKALHEYFMWQLESLTRALARFEIPYDPKTIEATLMGHSISDREFEADLGNLPRFLADIGFGPQFESWVEEMSAPVEVEEPDNVEARGQVTKPHRTIHE